MSFAELKEQVAELTVEERFKLSAFLAELEQEKEADFREEVDRRMKAMDAGAKVIREQFRRAPPETAGRGPLNPACRIATFWIAP